MGFHESESHTGDHQQRVGEMKHEHYHKNVSHLDSIDVYRVLKLYGVTDPCVQHAVKKLLCSGQRGVKTESQDVQEAIDALNRYLQMSSEDDSFAGK